MTNETVTFQTILDPTRETAKAYKVWTKNFLPKSLVTIVPTGRTAPRPVYNRHLQDAKVMECPVVNITMPKWLAER
jgi:hypothetical protein